MALTITPNQPLTPLETLACCENEYNALFQSGDNIYLQATHEPCSCLECELWGDNAVTNSEFTGSADGWDLTNWVYTTDNICITGDVAGRTACTSLASFVPDTWYKVVFDVEITEGCVKVSIAGGNYSADITVSGHYEIFVLGASVADQLCFETCGVTNTICLDNVYAYPLECVTLEGSGWTPTDITEEKDTPDPNLINGTFNSLAGWLIGATSTLGANLINLNDFAEQTLNIYDNERYNIGFTVSAFTGSGNLKVYLGGALIATITADGSYTYQVDTETIENKQLKFIVTSASLELSAVTATGEEDWIRVIKTVFCHDGTIADTSAVQFLSFLTANTLYKVTVEVENMTQGDLLLTVGSSNSDLFTSNGTYTRYLNSGSSTDMVLTPSADFDGCVRVTETCEMLSDYEFKLYTEDGVLVTTLDEFVSYHHEYVTLFLDPTQICLQTACTTAAVTHFSHVTIDSVAYPAPSPILVDDEEAIEAFLNGLGFGTYDYRINTGEYCVVLTSGDYTLDSATFLNGAVEETTIFSCVRQEMPTGCYKICVDDWCPEFGTGETVIEAAYEDTAEQDWFFSLWTADVPTSQVCTDAEIPGINMGVAIASLANRDVTVRFTVQFSGTQVSPSLSFEQGNGGTGNLVQTITADGYYEIAVNSDIGQVQWDIDTADTGACVSDISFVVEGTPLVEVPQTYCTPVFKYSQTALECTKKISSYDQGEQMGFYFDNGFKLEQRIEADIYGSNGTDEGDDYKYSDGRRTNIYREQEELFVFGTELIDRNAHNTLRVQRALKNFIIDGLRWFGLIDAYRPEYEATTPTANAPVQFRIRKEQGTLYKRS